MTLLDARHLYKDYGPACVLLKDINLMLSAGESLAIMGKSGVGKSTLLHILGTLESPSSGELWIAGTRVEPSKAAALRNALIGFVFQACYLFEEATVLDNVLMPARIARYNVRRGSAAYERAIHLIDEVELSNRLHLPVKFLSGGERQRVTLARGLQNDPMLLLADEPSGNLDTETSEKIHELLIACCRKRGKALIIVTHDAHLASLLDRRVVLRRGVLEVDTCNCSL